MTKRPAPKARERGVVDNRIGHTMNIRPLVAAFAAAAAIAPTTAHADPGFQAAETKCTFYYNTEPYVKHNAVLVGGYAECTRTPLTVHLELELYYKPRGAAPTSKSRETADGVPNPRLIIATAALDCVSGLWQGRASITATWDKGTVSNSRETEWTIISC